MILQLQFRTEQSGWHEIKCTYEKVGIPFDKFLFVNVGNPAITPELLMDLAKRSDAVIISGLAESGFEETDPVKLERIEMIVEKIEGLLKELVSIDHPTLAICFGHQLLSNNLGCQITQEKSFAETGLIKLTVTPEGRKDPIFGQLKQEFHAIEGHKSSVIKPPDGSVILAEGGKCPLQAYRLKSNIYSVQFHPELDLQDLADRVKLYPSYSANAVAETEVGVEVDGVIVLQKFVERYINLS